MTARLQVVVSSGMHLSDDAIVVKDMPGGLAFINDGLGTTDVRQLPCCCVANGFPGCLSLLHRALLIL